MSTRDPHDVVRVAKARNPPEAHIWRQALESEGIEAKVVGDFLDAGLGDISGVEPEVWVHRDDLARATEIIRQGQIAHEDQELEQAASESTPEGEGDLS